MSETEVSTEGQVVDTESLDDFSNDFFGQKPEQSADKTKAESEQDEETTEDDESTEAQKTEADPNEDPEAEYKEAPKKKPTVQDRIDELVKQREDAKREARAELDALRKEFEDYKTGGTKADVQATKSEPMPDAITADGEPVYPLGEFDPQYIRDLTRFTLEEERTKANALREQEERTRVQATEAAQLQAGWNTKLETATVEYPDLVEKGQALLANFNNLPADYSNYLTTVLMSMDKGPDVLYYLSNHPEEATTIVNSGAQRATLALGRIEAKFLEADAQKQLAKPKVSKAPPPPAERARGTNGAFITVAPDTDNLEDFEQAFFAKKK